MLKVFVKTLGCKVNSFDSHALENQFKDKGYALAGENESADVTIVNTCSVTANAERQARYLARRYKRANPKSLLVMIGCYAQTDSAALAAMKEVDLVLPNEIKHDVANLVTNLVNGETPKLNGKLPEGIALVKDNRQSHFKSSLTLFDRADSTQTRAFLKIQDGCNGFCAYCLIPYARGASRSVNPELVLTEAKRLVAQGCQEIVLTGIHIGDYGEDLKDQNVSFITLLTELFTIEGLNRLRISSLEPSELSLELIQLLAKNREKFCDHFHLPLQSGSARILKSMRRTYSKEEYAQTVHMIREYFPKANIGADVIAGFPGETPEEHAETEAFIQAVGLNYLHVFPYSKRPNTLAARLSGHLSQTVVDERSKALRELSKSINQNYVKRFIGETLGVLWENDFDKLGRRKGHTANYLNVVHAASRPTDLGLMSLCRLKGLVEANTFLGVPTELC